MKTPLYTEQVSKVSTLEGFQCITVTLITLLRSSGTDSVPTVYAVLYHTSSSCCIFVSRSCGRLLGNTGGGLGTSCGFSALIGNFSTDDCNRPGATPFEALSGVDLELDSSVEKLRLPTIPTAVGSKPVMAVVVLEGPL